ncbi:TIR domain-containing protein [Listeria riparia]|uniref:TIR domain-containing protein n=1 Tax=Listeria riparia TaxID=1494964 RepID=UPI00098D22DB
MKEKKVFISYEWNQQQWVLEFATKLRREAGIDVVLDVWDLEPGQDKYSFMESMVTSNEVDKVLLICDAKYKAKADSRSGGVGTEAQIITPDIYSNTSQTKFIAIIAEGSSFGDVPVFVQSRIHINLSDDITYADEYEKLVRHIYEMPKEVRPALGGLPSFLSAEESVDTFKLQSIGKDIHRVIDTNKQKAQNLFTSFVEEYIEILTVIYKETESIDNEEEFSDEVTMKNLEKTIKLQQPLLEAVQVLSEAGLLNSEMVIDFMEQHFELAYKLKMSTTSKEYYFDHIYFMMHEAFLIIIVYLVKYKNYIEIGNILNSKFYYKGVRRDVAYGYIRFKSDSLSSRNTRLKLNRISIHGDILKKRFSPKFFEELTVADLLLYYVPILNPIQYPQGWWPVTALYADENNITLFRKLKSKHHFEQMKCIFNIDSEEFKNKLRTESIGSFHYHIPSLVDYIDGVDNLCSEV